MSPQKRVPLRFKKASIPYEAEMKLHTTTSSEQWADELIKAAMANGGKINKEFLMPWFSAAILCGYDERAREKNKN